MSTWTEDAGPPPPPRRPPARPVPGWGVFLLSLLAVLWLLGAPAQAWGWLTEVLSQPLPGFLPGDTGTPTWAGRVDAQRHARTVLLLGLLPAAGLLLALRWRRAVVAVLFGGAAVVSVLVGAWMVAAVTPDAPDVPDPAPRYCQEHSGGEATCPGG